MVTIATRHRPRNFAEFWWYTDFTAMLMLVQNTPLAFCIQKSKLIMHTFQTSTELWDACPIKINLLARTLFERLTGSSAKGHPTNGTESTTTAAVDATIPHSDDFRSTANAAELDSINTPASLASHSAYVYNLVFVVQQICNLNRLAYYVAVSLLWAALYRYVGQPIQMFRMHRLGDLVQLLQSVDLERPLELQLDRVHGLLTLVSAMQSLVMLRKPRHEEYVCFRGFFRVTPADLRALTAWLQLLKGKMEYVGAQRLDNEDCLQIIEMLDLDILHFMEQKLQEVTNNGEATYE